MKFGVIIFPGSNCDHDAFWTIQHVAKQPVTFLWHESHDLENCDAMIVPGGFAYGDYLRTGAIAKFSPVMQSVRKFAGSGGLVLGICNGFQILCESGLLPGALMRNVGLKYVCKPVQVRVENVETPFTNACREGGGVDHPHRPHGGQLFLRPCDSRRVAAGTIASCSAIARPAGEITAAANPNGSLDNIAGICSPDGNVVGMMPHPERSAEPELGCTDGVKVFQSMVGAMARYDSASFVRGIFLVINSLSVYGCSSSPVVRLQTQILCLHTRGEACLSMTPKQILDSFSETLMRDERILSAQERALLGSLLQHAKAATEENPETQEAVRAVDCVGSGRNSRAARLRCARWEHR